jgi:NAD(P)-dependent dehydrogenase (short-subunit alcohol dehydrogenase family)
MRFSNKFVIATGAAGGIGSAIVRRFLAEGANVCAVDNRKEALDRLTADLGAPDALLAIEADVSSEESCYGLAAKVEQNWGAVDILFKNYERSIPASTPSRHSPRQVCSQQTRSQPPLLSTGL